MNDEDQDVPCCRCDCRKYVEQMRLIRGEVLAAIERGAEQITEDRKATDELYQRILAVAKKSREAMELLAVSEQSHNFREGGH